MGIFNGPPVTDAQRELVEKMDARTREWYLQAEIETLYIRVSELKEINRRQEVVINELRLVNSFEDVAWKAKDERIAELEAALKPFAEQAEFITDDNGSLLNGLCSPAMSKKDFFAARKVLGEKG